jgi:hypothetical protein
MTHRGRRTNKVIINLRMPEAKRAKLQAIADKRGLTRSELLGIYIDVGIEADESQINSLNGTGLLDRPDLKLGDGPRDEHDHHMPIPGAPGLFVHATVEQPKDLPGLEVDETEAQEALEASVDRAILEVVHDSREADLGAELDAQMLAEIGADETPDHLHGPWAQVFGTEVLVAGIRHATFMCAQCGGSKFDAVH